MSQEKDSETKTSEFHETSEFHSGINLNIVKAVAEPLKIVVLRYPLEALVVGFVVLALSVGIPYFLYAEHQLRKVPQLLEDTDSAVRCEGVKIIEKYGGKSHLQLIKPLLDNHDRTEVSVLFAAVETIEKLGDTSYKSWLLPLLSDPREEVRMAAESALQTLASHAESN